MDIITRSEALAKGLTFYFTGNPCKHGHLAERRVTTYGCSQCRYLANLSKSNKAYQSEYNKSITGKLAQRKFNQSSKGKNLRRQYNSSEAGRGNQATYAKTFKGLACTKKYFSKDTTKALCLANSTKYKCAKLHRTPVWSDLEAIKEIYAKCPKGHHVDHIIPLQGKLVSGLHIASNLQYLTPTENISKGNSFEVK